MALSLLTELEKIKLMWKIESELDSDFENIMVICEQPQPELDNVLGIVAYCLAGPLAVPTGEFSVSSLSSTAFLAVLDSTKSGRDDLFEDLHLLRQYLSEGTPVRTTDRAGPGTKGTRKYHRVIGPFEIYFN